MLKVPQREIFAVKNPGLNITCSSAEKGKIAVYSLRKNNYFCSFTFTVAYMCGFSFD